MGNRITKVTTKTGDKGMTRLGDRRQVSKSDLAIELLGSIDELQACLGVLLANLRLSEDLEEYYNSILQIEQWLFNLNGEVAMPGFKGITEKEISVLEEKTKLLNDALPPLRDFVVPGADLKSAYCHLARAVARRCERCWVKRNQEEKLSDSGLVFLNRLSDYLFVLARTLHLKTGIPESIWQKPVF